MSVAGKIVVVLGATGYVGGGAAAAFLAHGATVVAVGREESKLNELKGKLNPPANQYHQVVGNFETETDGAAVLAKVNAILGGKTIDHVVSSIGFIADSKGKTLTQVPLSDFQNSLQGGGLWANFVAAKTFVPVLKSHAGASFTVVSGGFSHFCPDATFWTGTLKNAALNGFVLGLGAETKNDPLRVNALCIHYGVAGLGFDKNQWGWDAVPTRKIGELFVALAVGKEKGSIVCTKAEGEIAELVEKLSKQ